MWQAESLESTLKLSPRHGAPVRSSNIFACCPSISVLHCGVHPVLINVNVSRHPAEKLKNMVQEQVRKYKLQGLKTQGGQPIILGARGNAVTSGRRAAQDNGAGKWQCGSGHQYLRNFGGRIKVHSLACTVKTRARPGSNIPPMGSKVFALGFHLRQALFLIEAIRPLRKDA